MTKNPIPWQERSLAASMIGLAIGILIGTAIAITMWQPIDATQLTFASMDEPGQATTHN